jgi:hypothetical protein
MEGVSQNVGIDIVTPVFKLDVRNGSINTDSLYRIGTKSVLSVRGNQNVFIGKYAGLLNIGTLNSFCGDSAGYSNNTGHFNSFFGGNAGRMNNAASNSFFGAECGKNNTTGYFNSFFGKAAGQYNSNGHENAFFGALAGYFNTTGYFNSFFGLSSGSSNVGGYENTFFGKSSGYGNTSGYQNSFFGNGAGGNNLSGTLNTILGSNADLNTGNLSNASAIGANTQVDCSNCMVLGSVNGVNGATSNVNVGVGITNPVFKLDVRNGSINTDSVYRIGTFTILSTKGIGNVFIGKDAGRVNTGLYNTFTGNVSGYNNTTGSYNSYFGDFTGLLNTSGDYNVSVGSGSLTDNLSGSYNSAIGYNAEVNSGALTNATVLGAQARVDCSNCMVLGSVSGINGASSNVNVGIGHTSPGYPLTFAQTTGDKISLYNDATSSYGFGIQGALLQIHTNVSGADIAFGYGNSASFSELMRIKGTGFVGIGTSGPTYKLDIKHSTSSLLRMENSTVLATNVTTDLWFKTGTFFTGGIKTIGDGTNLARLGFFTFASSSSSNLFERVSILDNGFVGINTTTPGERLSVTGNICATGTIGACSDIRFKKNLKPLDHSLEKILDLQGLYYFWKQEGFEERGFSDQRQIGFAAQEVEKYFPEIVQTDSKGYKAVDYGRLTPVLTEAIKEQQDEINSLQSQIRNQQEQIDALKKLLELALKD